MPKEYPQDMVQPPGHHNKKSMCTRTEHFSNYVKMSFEYLNPLQTEFVKYLEDDDTNIVIAAPTSSGKTLCAELFAARSIQNGYTVLYIAPMKALADEKYDEWTNPSHTFSKYKVQIQTGDFELTEAKKRSLEEANIIILTPEMFNSKCRFFESHAWLHKTAIVADEIHLVGMSGRGDSLEVGIVQYYENNQKARSLFLSATIPNYADFGVWLEHLTGRKTVSVLSDFRPCKLNSSVVGFQDSDNRGRSLYYQEIEEKRLEKAVELILEHKGDPIIAFVGAKDFGSKLSRQLTARSVKHYFHSADLDREERAKIENGFRSLDFTVLISTTTTAWGVNTPARYVIQCHTAFGLEPMHPANIHQAMGRAGRLGYSDEGDAIILAPRSKVNMESDRIFKDYKIMSVLNDVNILMFHILSYISQGEIKNADQLFEWYSKTLSSVQKRSITKEKSQMVLDNLVYRGMIKKEDDLYKPTKLGSITARMYMSPIDVSDWFKNFSGINKINPHPSDSEDVADNVNLSVAMALSECYNWGRTWSENGKKNSGKVYMSKREAMSPGVIRLCNRLHMTPQENPHIKYTSIFYDLLSGRDVEPMLNSFAMSIKRDLERIIDTLKQSDDQFGKMVKSAGKCVGFNWGKEWDSLYMRLKYGVSQELLDLVQAPGIGKAFATKLYENGIKSRKDLLNPSNQEAAENALGKKRYESTVEDMK